MVRLPVCSKRAYLCYIYSAEEMPRPKNRISPAKVVITGTPKLAAYLEDLVVEEGYGNTPAEVARSLVWRGIEDLISRSVLSRRRGAMREPPAKRRGRATSP